MPKLTIVFAAAVAFILSLAAVKAAEPAPKTTADVQAMSQKVLDTSPGAAEHWKINEEGILKHKESGLPCFPQLPPLTLAGLSTLPSAQTGEDNFTCHYLSEDKTYRATLFLARYQGEDLEKEFNMTMAVMQVMGNGKISDNTLTADNVAGGKPFTGGITKKDKSGNPIKTSLWLNEIANWKYKIRMTYPDTPETNAKAETAAVLMWAAGANSIAAANR